MFSLLCLLSACQSPPTRPRKETPVSEATRNNCYSLLHQLLDEEKDVSVLRFIKRENSDLKNLTLRVAAAAKEGAGKLEDFAKHDPSLVLDEYQLPLGEKKTRDSISAAKQKELLHNSGGQFEMILILSQVEALNYASHLAKVAGENDFEPGRSRYLAVLSLEMKELHDAVVSLLALHSIPPTAGP